MFAFDIDAFRRMLREEVRAALVEERQPRSPEVMTINEAAEHARLHHSTIRAWIKDGSLRASRVGRVWRIRREDLLARLAAGVSDSAVTDIEKMASEMLRQH